MERHQHAGVKNIFPLGAGYGISFSQTRTSHKKPHGSVRETCHLCGQNDIRRLFFLSIFFPGVNIEQQECRVKFCIFWGSFGHFYMLTEFSRHICA